MKQQFISFCLALVSVPALAATVEGSQSENVRCVEVSRSESQARNGEIDGTICIQDLEGGQYSFKLTLPKENFSADYRVKDGICFGAGIVAGCSYSPSGVFNTVGVGSSTRRVCGTDSMQETWTTFTIGDVPFYNLSKNTAPCQPRYMPLP